MEVGDLVKIQTYSLHFQEGAYGIITSCFSAMKQDSMGEIRWYTVLIGEVEYCFKFTDLVIINENR